MTMAKLTLTTFVTLDGVMQAPGGPDEDRADGFPYGGWVAPHFDEQTGAAIDAIFRRANAFLLGRFTYDTFAQFWPKVTDPQDFIAKQLNELPKYVASKKQKSFSWKGATHIEPAAEAIAAL
jgi:dihydrofolate reductase